MSYRTAPAPHPLVHIGHATAVALDPETGRELWRFQTKARIARVLLAHESVYLLDMDCHLHCVVAATGALLGTVDVAPASSTAGAMIACDGKLFVATSTNVTALSPDGKVLWSHDAPGGSSLVLAGLALPGSIVQPDFRE